MSYRGNVEVNANGFWAVPTEQDGTTLLVHRSNIDQFGPAYRLSGAQQQQDVSSYTAFLFPNLTLGFGRDRIDSDSAYETDEYRRFFDSTCETRFARDIRLGILSEDSTETGLEVIRASASFKNNLWALWGDDSSTDIVARLYDGSEEEWAGGGDVSASSNAGIALDLMAHKSNLIALLVDGADGNDVIVRTSSDGASWSSVINPYNPSTLVGGGALNSNVSAHENIDAGLLAEIGGEAVAAVWEEGNGSIFFCSSTDGGANWSAESPDVPAGSGVTGLAVMAGMDNEDKLYVGTREGLWEVDTAPSTWTHRLLFPMTAHIDNCRRMTVHNGSLWFAQGVDDNSPAPIYRLTNQTGIHDFQVGMGLNTGDGLPLDLLGSVHWMKSTGNFLFISVGGGAASRNARVLCHNGKGWHSMVRHGTANKEIQWIDVSADDDATPRLHYAVRTSSSASDTKFLEQPLANPQSGVSIDRETSGYIDLPYIDAGMPLISKSFLRVGINAEDLSASTSNEYINVDYGEDDGSGGLNVRSNTDLGNFLSGTSIITFASNAGLSSRNLGLRINLIRDGGTDTDTPKLKDVEIDALPHIPIVQRFRLRIDLVASAALEDTTVEAKISQLETATDSVIQVPFQYANMTRTYVAIKSISYIEELVNPGGDIRSVPDTNSQRAGFADLVLEEVI